MGFKKRRGVRRTYDEQGLIYFTCKTYRQQPREMQEKIRELCERAGGENAEALFVFLTTHVSRERILEEYHIGSETTLYRAIKRFFEGWEMSTGKRADSPSEYLGPYARILREIVR